MFIDHEYPVELIRYLIDGLMSLPAAFFRIIVPITLMSIPLVARSADFSFTLIATTEIAQVGQPLELIATVAGSDPYESEVVSFNDAFGTIFGGTYLCADIPVNIVGSEQVASCSVIFGEAGLHDVAAELGGGLPGQVIPVTNDVLINVTEPTPFDANPFWLTTSANAVQTGQPVELIAEVSGDVFDIEDGDIIYFNDGFGSTSTIGDPVCENVHVQIFGNTGIAHCIVTFDAGGQHDLVALYNLYVGLPGQGVPVTNDVLINVTEPTPFDANQFALTGAWANPATSGQGLLLGAYPDLHGDGTGFLFGGWMTFDADGHQRWYTLSGDLSSAHGASYDLDIYATTDGTFGTATPTVTSAVGSATLRFYDCTHAALFYAFDDGRSGTLPYVRLTVPSGCTAAVPAVVPSPLPANQDDVLHAGVWADPATSGQGLVIDIVPAQNTFFGAWYTYLPASADVAGEAGQRWFTLQAAYTPGDLTALHDVPIYATTGGVFSELGDVATEVVGTADIQFTSCTTMTLDYRFTAGEFAGLSGSQHEQAIVPVSGCQ